MPRVSCLGGRMATVTLLAPAKVNLYLAVGPRRTDGYHGLVTVFQALDLCDVIEYDPDASFRVTYEPDLGLAPGEDLVSVVSLALAERIGRDLRGAFTIHKHIPAAGGLGGGSSDAAAAIVALCATWGIQIDSPEVAGVARSVGADVAFFLEGGTALYTGRGDQLARRLPDPDMDIVVVNPGEPVPTGAAYAAFDRLLTVPPPAVEPVIEALIAEPQRLGGLLFDSLTEASTGLVPVVGDALAFLRLQEGVAGAEMAGSGSTVFGLCADRETAVSVARQAHDAGWWAAATHTSPYGARVSSVAHGSGSLG